MTPIFEVIYPSIEKDIATIACVNQHSPFNTPAYSAAYVEMGKVPCVLALRDGSQIVSGCLGFIQGGILSRRLEMVSAPQLLHPTVYWNGVFDFCPDQGV